MRKFLAYFRQYFINMAKQKFMVTSALPYANGPIHLGHIAGAYLPADIFVRFQKLIGNDVVYICGTDEHGVPITLRAEQEGVTPRVIVQRYHENIKSAFERMNISFDIFSGTSNVHNKHHAKISREFFINLLQNNLISSHISDQHYCEKCDRFLPDRFIQGTCPKCGYLEARGDECSACNKPFDSLELKNPKCKICGTVPNVKPTKHWYLRLDLLQSELEQWLDTKKGYWKENVINFVRGWFKDGLTERAITRDLYWGVPVPLNEESAGKVLYVWFDAPIGYISATMEWAERNGNIEKWKDYWQNPECKIVHFIGKDNIPFHAIIWPGMLMGQRKNYGLPWQIPANEYLTFGVTAKESETAEKASKSKGNVLWVHESLDLFPADMLRYFLAANAPEKTDTMFTWHDFQNKCNTELLNTIGNLFNRVLKFISQNFNGQIPEPNQTLSARDQEVLQSIQNTTGKVKALFENFEVRQAVSEVVNLGRFGNQYFDEKAPWKSLKENKIDCQTTLYISAQLCQAIAVMLSPVIPESMQKIWKQLGHTEKIDNWDLSTTVLPANHKIGIPEGLFQKVENETVAKLEKQLSDTMQKANEGKTETKTASEPQTPAEVKPTISQVPVEAKPTAVQLPVEVKPSAETKTAHAEVKSAPEISLDEFQRIEIRMGEILSAQRVPKAKKLLQLTVKIGEETRTLVSGIAEAYEPEAIVGKKVPVLVNLKPATIRGVVSQGMILCPDVEGIPVLLYPEKDVPSGSLIK